MYVSSLFSWQSVILTVPIVWRGMADQLLDTLEKQYVSPII